MIKLVNNLSEQLLGGRVMSSELLYNALASARKLKDSEKVILIKEISKLLCESPLKDSKDDLLCPHCGSTIFVKNGKLKERQRYLCKKCYKSFNSLTNTPISYSKKGIEKWLEYMESILNQDSLRTCASKLEINLSTAFIWRHKILDAIRSNVKTKVLEGDIQVDETYFKESFKGNHSKSEFKMPRKAYKRGTPSKYRGISKEQVCVLTALDINESIVIEPSCMGRPGSSDLLRVLSDIVKKESTIISDSFWGYNTLASYCKSKHIAIPTGKHSFGKYNIQRINSIHSKLKSFIRSYKGVSTKYLSNYLYLFKYIQCGLEATPLFFRGREPYLKANFKGRPPVFA